MCAPQQCVTCDSPGKLRVVEEQLNNTNKISGYIRGEELQFTV